MRPLRGLLFALLCWFASPSLGDEPLPRPRWAASLFHGRPQSAPPSRSLYGQALGAPTFNYGYFGARRNPQLWSHSSYYGESREHGIARGY